MDATVKVKLLFFAKSRELVGKRDVYFEVQRTSTPEFILKQIITEFPELCIIQNNLLLSLNEDYIDGEAPVEIKAGDEIAVIPPISGGEDIVDITEEKLEIDKISDSVAHPQCGAVSIFVGTTRDNFEGKSVLRLEYEAYMPMAKKEMLKVCQTIRERWDVGNIAMIHRIGVVPVKEASIVIAISSAHRKESLEAVHYAIDTVKATVPVWKKEVYGDDSTSWKQNKECAWSDNVPKHISRHSSSSGDNEKKEAQL